MDSEIVFVYFSLCTVLKFIWHIRYIFLFLQTCLKNNFWLFDNKSKQVHKFFSWVEPEVAFSSKSPRHKNMP